ncbi:hypothetical protein ACLMJK_005322 [Lecanora helva]
MALNNELQSCPSHLRKRPCDFEATKLQSVNKKRKIDAASASYPTPESTQASLTESSSEEKGQSTFFRGSQQKKNAERAVFTQDIGNYIPLGSLTLPISADQGLNLHDTEWIDEHIESDLSLASSDHRTTNHAGSVLSAQKLSESGITRLLRRKHQRNKAFATLRVYVLPHDVGRRFIDRQAWGNDSKVRKHLECLVNELDISPESWEGTKEIEAVSAHYDMQTKEEESLFYLFNTIPSPTLDSLHVRCSMSNDAIQSILKTRQPFGLNTQLYSYQKRTVARMIQREIEPRRALDPRFQQLKGPTGCTFFYDNVTGVLLRDERRYEEARGGILGESMGLGKTLICLATVLSTKGHWPDIPPEYSTDLCATRPRVGSLMQMAAASLGRTKVPWRALLQEASRKGEDYQNLIAMLEDNVGSYVIPPPPAKYSKRSTTSLEGKTVHLSTGTLVIVPQNLFSQWKNEISLHIEADQLRILYLEADEKIAIPPVSALLKYDVILISKPRFEKEMVLSENVKIPQARKAKGGCLCSLDEDCQCSRGEEYQTPLKEIHWLRIIMDEGHDFSSSGKSGTAYWALKNLRVDRKWIVSGTPANGLLGVEVGTATNETFGSLDSSDMTTNRDSLESRRKESALSQERKDLAKLGLLVTGFLQVKPWANSKEEDPASWQKYIMPHQDGRRKAGSLKKLLESLVVRHRIEDIEADIQLPPLLNRVVYLQPSWNDKLSVNLFLLNLTVNAVTSERVDQDYMFHPKNRRQLNALINNLRQAGFYWTGIPPETITKSLKVCQSYLEEHQDNTLGCSEADRILLQKAIKLGQLVLQSASWRSFAELHEMGMYVADFPEHARSAWSLLPAQESDIMLTGATQLAKAQKWVDNHLWAPDLCSGLAHVGTSTMEKLWQAAQQDGKVDASHSVNSNERSIRSPASKGGSSIVKVPRLTNERTMSRAKAAPISQKPAKPTRFRHSSGAADISGSTTEKPAMKSALKSSPTSNSLDLLPPESPLSRSRLVGTASAKLTYLLDRVTVLHQEEKILIFYEGDHIAWYIAQALDLIDVRYLIYTKSLSIERQTAYIVTFNRTETFRVLLMNVHQAAHGLHIASASRVFFVNPVWQPNVEAQAIKRAHRIGQVRPVYVETLVLKDTLEDLMLQRRKGMTAQEHQKAERSLLDDEIMSTMIKEADFIPLLDDEVDDTSKQMAELETSHQIFARPANAVGDPDDPDAGLIFPEASTLAGRKREEQNANISTMEDPTPLSDSSFLPSLPPKPNQTAQNVAGPSMSGCQSDITYAESISQGNDLATSTTPANLMHGHSADTPGAGQDISAPSNPSDPQGSASSSSTAAKRPVKRVGFALDFADSVDDESPSMFGSGKSARPSH